MLDNRIQPGIESEKTFTITDEMGTGHTGTVVLSTPSMIGLMEGTCLESVTPYLDDGEATVGIHVCVSHVAASVSGEKVTIRSASPTSIVGRSRLRSPLTSATDCWGKEPTSAPLSTPVASADRGSSDRSRDHL